MSDAPKTSSPAKSPPAPARAETRERPPVDPEIEPATGPGEDDEFDATDGYETSSYVSGAATTSVTSSIYAHTYEHGRRYQTFKNSRYPVPNDDIEQNREDMKHTMMLELTDGVLFYAPIENPHKILDVGTGTGIWAIDVADRYPGASVRGIDVSPIQPVWVPPNVEFVVDDCEEEWYMNDFDLVHLRFMVPFLRNVPKVLVNAFHGLKPGGWIELQELDGVPQSDDGTMKDDDPVKAMYDLVREAYGKLGMTVTLTPSLGPVLQEIGFTDIRCIVKKVPIGVWAKDKTLHLIGMYQRIAIEELMPTFAGRPFEALNIRPEEGQVRLASARQGLQDTKVHRYFQYYFWQARKPES